MQVDVSEGEEKERGLCRVVSETMLSEDCGGCGDVSFRADESLAPGEPEWANYVKGVVKELMETVRVCVCKRVS